MITLVIIFQSEGRETTASSGATHMDSWREASRDFALGDHNISERRGGCGVKGSETLSLK